MPVPRLQQEKAGLPGALTLLPLPLLPQLLLLGRKSPACCSGHQFSDASPLHKPHWRILQFTALQSPNLGLSGSVLTSVPATLMRASHQWREGKHASQCSVIYRKKPVVQESNLIH
ncbi:GD16113 [Drosophila simulans]|uniref:GD16113 n=1 Tax=Drosophila simulans TaxID=7240 RepID=B4NW21_DROSI|nr:GD16113 [Drosophila simulans]